jgi:hypothetical protein
MANTTFFFPGTKYVILKSIGSTVYKRKLPVCTYYILPIGFIHAHVFETILADPKLRLFSVFFGVGTEVPV